LPPLVGYKQALRAAAVVVHIRLVVVVGHILLAVVVGHMAAVGEANALKVEDNLVVGGPVEARILVVDLDNLAEDSPAAAVVDSAALEEDNLEEDSLVEGHHTAVVGRSLDYMPWLEIWTRDF
jgi:hypothetical protein